MPRHRAPRSHRAPSGEVVRTRRRIGVPVPRLSGARQRWRRPNAPRCRAHPRPSMPRPWIINTGVPSRRPHALYAISCRRPQRSPASSYVTRKQCGDGLSHRIREPRRGKRIIRVVLLGQRDEVAEAHAPSLDRTDSGPTGVTAAGNDRRVRHRLHQRVRRRTGTGSQPRRHERHCDQVAGVQRSGDVGRARSDRAETRAAPPRNGASGAPMTRSRRPVAR